MKRILESSSRLTDDDLQTLMEDAEFMAQEAFRYGLEEQVNYEHVVRAVQEIIDRRVQDK